MLATGTTEQTCRRSLSPVRFLGISAEEHQTFCAVFDLQIKVIDAEFYGMEGVQCMEYLLRLCEAVPVRIWMRHSTPHPPPIQVQLQSGVPPSSSGTSHSAPFRAISPGPDCPCAEFPQHARPTRMQRCVEASICTNTHRERSDGQVSETAFAHVIRLSEPSPPSNLSPVALRGLNTRPAGNTTPPSL